VQGVRFNNKQLIGYIIPRNAYMRFFIDKRSDEYTDGIDQKGPNMNTLRKYYLRFAIFIIAVLLLAAHACDRGTGPGDGDAVKGYVWLGNPYYSIGGSGGIALYNSMTGTEITTFDKIGGTVFFLYAMDSDYITGELYASYYLAQEDDFLGKFGTDGELIWSFEPDRKVSVMSYDSLNDWLWVWPVPGLKIYDGHNGNEFFKFPDDYDIRYVKHLGASPSDGSVIICSHPTGAYKILKYKGTGEKTWAKELGFEPDLLTVNRKTGDFWITDSSADSKIYKYSSSGNRIYEITVNGVVEAVAVDAERNTLWVSVSSTDTIIRFNASTGDEIDSITGSRGKLQIDEYDGAVLVSLSAWGTGSLTRLNTDLSLEYEVGVDPVYTDIKVSETR
jgi:hypothetical protein